MSYFKEKPWKTLLKRTLATVLIRHRSKEDLTHLLLTKLLSLILQLQKLWGVEDGGLDKKFIICYNSNRKEFFKKLKLAGQLRAKKLILFSQLFRKEPVDRVRSVYQGTVQPVPSRYRSSVPR